MLNSLIRNTAFSIFTNLLSRVGNTLLLVFIIRQMALDSGGQYDLGLSWFFIGSRFAFWGLDHLITREIAKDKASGADWIVHLMLARIILALLVICLIFVALAWTPYMRDTYLVIMLFAIGILPENINNLCLGIYAGYEEYHFSTVSTFVNMMVKVIGGLVVIYLGYGLVAVVLIIFVGHMIAMIINLSIINYRYLPTIPPIRLSFLYEVLPQATPFIFISIFYILDNRFDRILMSLLTTNDEIGIYASASTLLIAAMLPAQGYRIAVLPVMARLRDQPDKLHDLYYHSYKLLVIVAIPLSVMVMIGADSAIGILFGRSNMESVIILRLLMAGLIFIYLNTLFNRLLIIYNQQKLTAQFMGVTTIVNLLVNLWLIPMLGAEGAAISRLLSVLSLFILNVWVVRKHFPTRPLVDFMIRIILITLMSIGATWWTIQLGYIVALSTFCFTYLLGIMAGGIITANQYKMIKNYCLRS